MSKAKTGCVAMLIVAVPAMAVGGLGYFAWKSGKIPAKRSATLAPKADKVSTCRELAELLQTKGMNIRWVRRSASHPSIYVVRDTETFIIGAAGSGGVISAKEASDSQLESILNGTSGYTPPAIVTQYPNPQEAVETAGTRKSDFAWGRFVISGNTDLVKEIKDHL